MQFEAQRHLGFRDHLLIEFHIRRGQKALDLFSRPEVTTVHRG
jgi:hypothetical protein